MKGPRDQKRLSGFFILDGKKKAEQVIERRIEAGSNLSKQRFQIFLIIVLLCASARASAQTVLKSGTLIAVVYYDDRILVAAESQDWKGVPFPLSEEACKIRRLGKHAFFTASGLVVDQAIAAEKASVEVSTGNIQQIGTQWATDTIRAFQETASQDPVGFAARLHAGPDGFVTVGIFGTNVGNRLETYEVYISLDTVEPNPNKPGQAKWTFSQKILGPINESKAYGEEDKALIGEFTKHTIPRARAAYEAMIEQRALSKEDPDVIELAAAVQYALDNAALKYAIGGPIDILELPRSGDSSWKRVKSNCNASGP